MRSRKEEQFIIHKVDLNDSTYQSIKEFTLLSLKSCETLGDVCGKINDMITEKFSGVWQCFVYKWNFGNFSIQRKTRKYACFTVSGLNFAIYEAEN